MVDVGHRTLTAKGTDTSEADITEHREDDDSRHELAGMERKLVNEHTGGELERKPRVVMYHHVVFARTVARVLLCRNSTREVAVP